MLSRQFWSSCLSRRLLARLLSTLICAILIVLRPFSKLGGSSAFLALTVKELVFSVQENLAQQLESTVLNLTGGLIGIGISALGKFFASIPPNDTTIARTIPALFLVATAFLAGWLKSRLPRLVQACRISCFIAIWMLTDDVGLEQKIRLEATDFLWILLTASLTSLFSGLLLLRWSSPQFTNDVATALSKLHTCLSTSMETAFSESPSPIPPDLDIHRQLLKRSVALNSTYAQASFELRVGRVSVKSIKPLISTIEHLRRELSWGMSYPRPSHSNSPLETNVIRAFHGPAFELGNAILVSMKAVEKVILACFEHAIIPRPLQPEKDELDAAKCRLLEALTIARGELRVFCDDLDMQQRSADGAIGFPQKIFDLCLFMISLLQMAHEMRHALHLAQDVAVSYESSPPQLWHPRFSWAWLGATPNTFILEERGTFLDEEIHELQTTLSLEETLQGLAESHYAIKEGGDEKDILKKTLTSKPLSLRWSSSLVRCLWSHPRTIQARLYLSGLLRSIQRSSHLRHALKNAAGVALLSIPAFLPLDDPGHNWFSSARAQWMVISYIWVLETNTGATWRVGYLRITGTLTGAIYAYVASLICRTNPYGMVALVVLAELPISWIVINTTFPSLGVVASITLPPIIFTQYFHPDPPISPLKLAILRAVMIAIGIVAALTMNSAIFPRHCRVMFLNSTSRTLGLLSQLYVTLSRDLFHSAPSTTTIDKHKILKLELNIRNALHRMTILLTTMNDELSLVPKPMQRYRQVVIVLQKLLDLLTGLRKVRENIPRKETVMDVAAERRELVSCICVSIFACEQVFKARQPLPQFLPSCRQALDNLERHVEECIRLSRQEDTDSIGLSLIYAFAETDILTELVDTLEELLDLSRQLFGTSSWFNPSPMETTLMMSLHEEVGSGLR